jgi:hypothetical protein
VGTIYGGSMYGAVDPVYMIMLIRMLGDGYTVWDKAASIRFVRPGRNTLFGVFTIEPHILADIRAELQTQPKTERLFTVELKDDTGLVYAVIEKRLHVSRRDAGSASREPAPLSNLTYIAAMGGAFALRQSPPCEHVRARCVDCRQIPTRPVTRSGIDLDRKPFG